MSRRRYSAEFKAQAIGLVEHGKPVAEVAQELEISEGVLYAWVRQGAPAGHAAGEEPAANELGRLRREVAKLKMENDILKKAAVILGTKPLPERAP